MPPKVTPGRRVATSPVTLRYSAGADIFGSSDQFHFVYKQLSGDGQIVARVASVQNTNSRAKAGVMFRDTLAAGSKEININIAPDNTSSYQYRTATNGGSALPGELPPSSVAPVSSWALEGSTTTRTPPYSCVTSSVATSESKNIS